MFPVVYSMADYGVRVLPLYWYLLHVQPGTEAVPKLREKN